MVSISDVARRAGVSPTTVSHALSGKRRVSEPVRQKVHRAMAELEYVPTRAARSLALGKTSVIALVVPDIAIEYFAELTKGIETAAVERGYNTILATTGFDAARESRYLEMIGSRAVDGIVFASGAPAGSSARAALTGRLPVVLVDEEVEGLDLATVVSDNRAGGGLVAEHLLALGHRSALEIRGFDDPVTSLRRSAGFAERWDAAGGRTRRASGDYTAPGGRAAVDAFAEELRTGAVTAVFAHNDLMALGAINRLRELGLEVPRDVAVVGFDDMTIAQYGPSPLTTVRQEPLDLGTRAVTTLLDALESGEPPAPERVLLPVRLIVRDSTGPVRA